jgi:hypothetical protein
MEIYKKDPIVIKYKNEIISVKSCKVLKVRVGRETAFL